MLMKYRNLAMTLLLLSTLLSTACQNFVPQAQGLVVAAWPMQNYQRQDQLEVQWQAHQFSFLLYQQQQGQNLQMIALSLTGQQLFKVNFDGQHVKVEQRIEQMKYLPFEFVVRDILYATYPNFVSLQASSQVAVQVQAQQKIVRIQNQNVLEITQQDDVTELRNLQVPYVMSISPMLNTLQSDGEADAF